MHHLEVCGFRLVLLHAQVFATQGHGACRGGAVGGQVQAVLARFAQAVDAALKLEEILDLDAGGRFRFWAQKQVQVIVDALGGNGLADIDPFLFGEDVACSFNGLDWLEGTFLLVQREEIKSVLIGNASKVHWMVSVYKW